MVSWRFGTSWYRILFLMVTIWLGVGSTHGQESIIPPGGENLLPVDSTVAMRLGGRLFLAWLNSKIVPVADQAIEKAWRIDVGTKPAQPWHVNLHVDLQGSIRKGDIILIVFQMRCIETEDKSGKATVLVKVQQKSPPHSVAGAVSVWASQEWKSFFYPLRAQQSLAQGQGNVSIHLGYGVQTL